MRCYCILTKLDSSLISLSFPGMQWKGWPIIGRLMFGKQVNMSQHYLLAHMILMLVLTIVTGVLSMKFVVILLLIHMMKPKCIQWRCLKIDISFISNRLLVLLIINILRIITNIVITLCEIHTAHKTETIKVTTKWQSKKMKKKKQNTFLNPIFLCFVKKKFLTNLKA